MIIELTYNGSDYSIVVEAQQFVARKHYTVGSGKTKGETTFREIGYFSKLGGAVKKIVATEFEHTDETVTLFEYCDRLEKAYKDLLKQTDL